MAGPFVQIVQAWLKGAFCNTHAFAELSTAVAPGDHQREPLPLSMYRQDLLEQASSTVKLICIS